MRLTPLFTVLVAMAALGVGAESDALRTPVLVELFTSEGCSSCPPADRLLAKLDREQPVAGAELIVLSEHVDYWNHLGWKDPFSSAVYSERQRQYARQLQGEVYTPQAVVNGSKALVGSEEAELRSAVREAARHPAQMLQVAAARAGKEANVEVRTNGSPDGSLYIAVAHEATKSQVLKGENAGSGLSHVAVVYSISRGVVGENRVHLADDHEKTRVVAFVANKRGQVTAVGEARF